MAIISQNISAFGALVLISEVDKTLPASVKAFQDSWQVFNLHLKNTTVAELNAFGTQTNAVRDEVNTLRDTVVAKEALVSPHYAAIDSVAANATNINSVVTNILDIQNAEENALLAISAKDSAIIAKNDALTAAAAAVLTANVTKWVSGTTYAEGSNTWSPISFYTYRRKIAGAGTVDPSLDPSNWLVQLPLLGIDSENITVVGSYQITNINKMAMNFSITANATVTLPNATTIPTSVVRYLYNSSGTYYIQVNDFSGIYKYTLSPRTQATLTCVDTSTSTGVWAEQNIVQFNPIFAFPAVDIVNALDSTAFCGIAKTSISTSNYYTLFYRNTSSNLVIQSATIINGAVTYGNSATIATGVANVPSNIVALNTSTNTGIVVYQNSTILYVRTFTNVNGTLTLGTVYSLADYYAPIQNGYDTTYDTTAEAVSTTELLLNTQATANSYPSQTVFTTTTNTFFSGGGSAVGHLSTLIKSDLIQGKYYLMLYDNSGNLTTYKKAYTVTSSAISTTLYLATDYGFAYNSGDITALEIGTDIILVAYKSGLSATSTTVKVVNWSTDTNHYANSMISVDMINQNLSLRKVGVNMYMLIGTSSTDDIIKSYLFKVDDSYKTTVIGYSSSGLVCTAGTDPMVCKYIPDSGRVTISYSDNSRVNQKTLLDIKSR